MSENLRKYTDWRAWLRHLAKGSVHAGTGALLAGGGTHMLAQIPVDGLRGMGLSILQVGGVFISAAFWEAVRRINAATAEPQPPFAP